MEILSEHRQEIGRIARMIGRQVTVMEICGGHTNVIMKYGIRDILPRNIRLISGPGCPVCVSSQRDIDCIIGLAESGIPVATYGDMLRVPGSTGSLESARAAGARVFEVYSALEVLSLWERMPDVVFFGVGFETTAPMTAFLLGRGVGVYSVHKLVPPAMMALVSSSIDGFINPGHVSAVIGLGPYSKIPACQAVAGFSAERVLRGLRILLGLIHEGRKICVNAYPEAVRPLGNRKAQQDLRKHFKAQDSEWRGLGMLPMSGLAVRNRALDAKLKYRALFARIPEPGETGCRCADVLMGRLEPSSCPLFGKSCTPKNPAGACMVSAEGSCAIHYRYTK